MRFIVVVSYVYLSSLKCIPIDVDDFAVIRCLVARDQVEQYEQAEAERQEMDERIF
jgi:hypothetical protein